MEAQNDLSIVELAKKRRRIAQAFWALSREKSNQDILFSFGDTYNGNQYLGREGDFNVRESKGLLTINIVDPACKKIVNTVRMNRPQAKIMPGDSMASEQVAQIVEKWSRAQKSKSNADDATDCAVELQVRGGEGYFELDIEYETPESFNRLVKIKPIRDFNCILIDPDAVKSVDGTSAKWGFKFEQLPKEEVRTRYGKEPTHWENDGEWVLEDHVIVCRYVYAECEKKTLYQYVDGTSGYDANLKPLNYDNDGKPIKRTTYIEKWWDCILLGGEDEPVSREEWLGGLLPFCPVWGQLYCEDGNYYLKGETRNLVDQNRVINYVASKGVEAIAKQESISYMMALESKPDAQEGEDSWELEAKGVAQRVKFYKAYDSEGNALPTPFRETPAITPAAEFAAMDRFLEFAHNASGQFSAPGEISPNASGKAVNSRQKQADIATFHYPDNLSRALRYCEEQLINIFKKIHNPSQIIRLLSVDGTEEKAQVNPFLETAYAEAANKDNVYGAKHIINPELLGNLDVVINIGPSYQTQRQEQADIIAEMANKNPNLWQTHPDLIIDAIDLVNKDAWLERFKKVLPPGAIEDNYQEEIPPQAQQQIMQLQEQLKQMELILEQTVTKAEELQQANQKAMMQAAQAEAKAITTQIQAKRLELSMLETNPPSMPKETEKEDGAEHEQEDEAYLDPQLDEMIYMLEEQNIKQSELVSAIAEGQQQIAQNQMAIVETLSKPKTARIVISKQADGSYIGERIEE